VSTFLSRLVTKASANRSELAPRRLVPGEYTRSTATRDPLSTEDEAASQSARPIRIDSVRSDVREARSEPARPLQEPTANHANDNPAPELLARLDPRGLPETHDERLMPLAKPAAPQDISMPGASLSDSPAALSKVEPRPSLRRDRHSDRLRSERSRQRTPTRATELPNIEDSTVTIHIGRIDVRALPAPPAPTAQRSSTRLSKPSLDAYLSRRERGRP
jgi:hypothetical protein